MMLAAGSIKLNTILRVVIIGNQLLLLHEIEYKAAPQQTSVDNIDILVLKQIR